MINGKPLDRKSGFFAAIYTPPYFCDLQQRSARHGRAIIFRGLSARSEGIPQGLKPASVAGFVAKAEALAYLEANSGGDGIRGSFPFDFAQDPNDTLKQRQERTTEILSGAQNDDSNK